MIRAYEPSRDLAVVRACLVELQEFERALDPRLPSGDSVAGAYLQRLFSRCRVAAGCVFVAQEGPEVVGFVSVLTGHRSDEPEDDTGEFAFVADLVVRRSHRGLGLGRALLDRAEAHAREAGAPSLRLMVKGGNRPARDLYAERGYEEYEVLLEKRLT